jgi:hypothetical protein
MTSKISIYLVCIGVMYLPALASGGECNLGDGASTTTELVAIACRNAGGVPNGCSCDYPSRGSSGANSNYDYEAQRRAQEAQEAERQRVQQQRQQEAARKAREAAQRQVEFIRDRDAAAATLKGSSGSEPEQLKGLSSEADTVQLKGSEATGKKTTRNNCPPVTDSSVVDACNVPSGLPSAIDKAIAAVYGVAPPGVSDRVRKGFQAVMGRDWKVAKAWFMDALNHDPGNASLKRLVELSDYTETHIRHGKSGKLTASQDAVQMPKDSDLELLFPGWQPPVNPSNSTMLPKDEDLSFLFPGKEFKTQKARGEAKKLNDMMLDEAIKMTENDPVLIRVSNRHAPAKTNKHSDSGIHN